MLKNQSMIEFQFEFTDCNGKLKLLDEDGNTLLPNEDGHLLVHKQIDWPSEITFRIVGKDKFGTKIDNNGNISKDRAIKLTQLKVDGLMPDNNFLKRWPILFVGETRGNQIINSDYFGFNGSVTFEFSAKDAIHFMIMSNRFRDNFWNKD